MNIQKTNPFGIHLFNNLISGIDEKIINSRVNQSLAIDDPATIRVNAMLFANHRNAKVLRLSKNVINNAMLINIDSIKENITDIDLDFTSLYILLDNDKSGAIRVIRYANDISFLYYKDLSIYNETEICYNSFSFLTKRFLYRTQ